MYDNSEYTTFMQELDNMGFPLQCQNIAITDGSWQGAQTVAPESTILNIWKLQKFFLSLLHLTIMFILGRYL